MLADRIPRCGARLRAEWQGRECGVGLASTTPRERGLALGVGRRDQQAAHQAQVLQEVCALHTPRNRVRLFPEGMAGERRRCEGARQNGRREAWELARRKEDTARELDAAVHSDQRDRIGGDDGGDLVRQHTDGALHEGLRDFCSLLRVSQGVIAGDDEHRCEHRSGNTAEDHLVDTVPSEVTVLVGHCAFRLLRLFGHCVGRSRVGLGSAALYRGYPSGVGALGGVDDLAQVLCV